MTCSSVIRRGRVNFEDRPGAQFAPKLLSIYKLNKCIVLAASSLLRPALRRSNYILYRLVYVVIRSKWAITTNFLAESFKCEIVAVQVHELKHNAKNIWPNGMKLK